MKLTINRLALKNSFIVITLICLNGCASFDKEKMVIQGIESNKSHPYSVSVNVGDGNEEDDVGIVPVPRQDLLYAIEKSIRKGRTFEKIVSGEKGDFLLNVTIFTLEQPTFGGSFTVKLEAGWTLTKADGKVIWQEVIKSQHTATMSDSFAGATRFRMANDGAIRENIRQGITKLSALHI